MDRNLKTLVKRAKEGDEEAFSQLIGIFEPLFKKYCRKLNYEGAREDLTLWFIKTIKHLKI